MRWSRSGPQSVLLMQWTELVSGEMLTLPDRAQYVV